MPESVTISFVGTTELKGLLEQWAKQDERSISYIVRQILKREAQRRAQVQSPLKKPVSQKAN